MKSNNIICPHCKAVAFYPQAWDTGTEICEHCDKPFHVEVHEVREYTVTKLVKE